MEQIPTPREDIYQAAQILREGGLIAFPTETYYGLAVDPFQESALQRLFAVKNRPTVKPVLVLVPSRDHIEKLVESIPPRGEQLMDKYWPGPLTLVIPARKELSKMLTGATGTIGLRISPHPVAADLLEAYGGPLTATSANRSGGKAAVNEAEVRQIFGDEIDLILPGGQTPGLQPSTLVRVTEHGFDCLREGQIPCSEIQTFLASCA